MSRERLVTKRSMENLLMTQVCMLVEHHVSLKLNSTTSSSYQHLLAGRQHIQGLFAVVSRKTLHSDSSIENLFENLCHLLAPTFL